jgi:hypothetical protein
LSLVEALVNADWSPCKRKVFGSTPDEPTTEAGGANEFVVVMVLSVMRSSCVDLLSLVDTRECRAIDEGFDVLSPPAQINERTSRRAGVQRTYLTPA